MTTAACSTRSNIKPKGIVALRGDELSWYQKRIQYWLLKKYNLIDMSKWNVAAAMLVSLKLPNAAATADELLQNLIGSISQVTLLELRAVVFPD